MCHAYSFTMHTCTGPAVPAGAGTAFTLNFEQQCRTIPAKTYTAEVSIDSQSWLPAWLQLSSLLLHLCLPASVS